MLQRTWLLVCFLLFSLTAAAWSDGGGDGPPLTRAEVTGVKRMLSDLVAALGAPSSGYGTLEEDYDLPTTYQPHKSDGRFSPIHGGVRLRYGIDTSKAQKSMEQAAQEWQRKYLEASAKGDMEAVTRLTQEYQQIIANAQLQVVNANAARKEPIAIDIRLNSYQSATIDPDGVVFEKPGFIALAEKSHQQGMGRVRCFFDPVALKQTETLSQVKLAYPEMDWPLKPASAISSLSCKVPKKRSGSGSSGSTLPPSSKKSNRLHCVRPRNSVKNLPAYRPRSICRAASAAGQVAL